MAPPLTEVADIWLQLTTHLSTRKDERLSWPGWWTCSGRFTYISGHPSAAGRAQDTESSSAKDRRSTTSFPDERLWHATNHVEHWVHSPAWGVASRPLCASIRHCALCGDIIIVVYSGSILRSLLPTIALLVPAGLEPRLFWLMSFQSMYKAQYASKA